MYRIRKLSNPSLGMLKRIQTMDAVCFPGDDPVEIRPTDHVWVAYHKGELVGFSLARELADEPVLYFTRVGVMPPHRGCGLQKRFIRCRVAYARRLRCRCVITYTVHNPASSNSLISCGFRLYDPESAYAGEASQYWQLTL